VCEGLVEAHAAGLVHRDIKPANLFLTRRANGELSVKILDFGITKHPARQDQRALTDPGKRLGSPSYMSPEQMLAPASVDERADIWSLGVLLFELLTGRLPFEGDTMAQISTAVLTTSPTLPSELRPGISKELDEVILRCLQWEPKRRFCSAAELALALEPLLPERFDDSVTPLPSARDDRPLQANSRSRGVVALALVMVMVSAVLLAVSLQDHRSSLFRSASAMRIELPGDPVLLPDLPDPLKPRDEPLRVLPTLSRAYAVAEPQREATTPPPAGSWPPRSHRASSGDDENESIAQIYGF
jgi:serine/threonine protein kinase